MAAKSRLQTLQVVLFVASFAFFALVLADFAYQRVVAAAFFHPRISFDTTILDVGTVSHQDRVPVEFRFRNTGGAALTLQEIKPSCGGCIEVGDYPHESVAPGTSGVVKAFLLAENLSGDVRKVLMVKSTDPMKEWVPLTVVGRISPREDGDSSPDVPSTDKS